jgi:hypothetical protein
MKSSTANCNHPYRSVVDPVEHPEGPAARLARSIVELVVGAPRLPAAERVASTGASIAGFVTRPMRRVLEPAIEARAEAAQDAVVSLLELIRVAVQEAIELVDINALLDRVDINALVGRVDVGEIIRRVDLDEVVTRIDVTELISRVDVAAIIDRVDLNELVSKIDIDDVVERTEIGSLVVRSTSGVATEALDSVRSRAVGIDTTVTRVVDRLLRRSPGPVGPGQLAPDASV